MTPIFLSTPTEGRDDILGQVFDSFSRRGRVNRASSERRGATDAFATVIGPVPAGGRILDRAAGTGELAVGLALEATTYTDDAERYLVTARPAAEE